MVLEQLTEFFKWMTIINVGLMTLSTILIIALKGVIYKMHGKMFSISKEFISGACYGYLGVYKILIIVLNIVPFVSLLIIK